MKKRVFKKEEELPKGMWAG